MSRKSSHDTGVEKTDRQNLKLKARVEETVLPEHEMKRPMLQQKYYAKIDAKKQIRRHLSMR